MLFKGMKKYAHKIVSQAALNKLQNHMWYLGSEMAPVSLFSSKSSQSALELGPSHCPNGRLGQDLGFVGFAFALKLPELLNTNLPTVRAKLGQTSSFPNGHQIWFPIGQ